MREPSIVQGGASLSNLAYASHTTLTSSRTKCLGTGSPSASPDSTNLSHPIFHASQIFSSIDSHCVAFRSALSSISLWWWQTLSDMGCDCALPSRPYSPFYPTIISETSKARESGYH